MVLVSDDWKQEQKESANKITDRIGGTVTRQNYRERTVECLLSKKAVSLFAKCFFRKRQARDIRKNCMNRRIGKKWRY